jgi:uncharacterized protein (TIRG00374 family)
MAMRESVAFAFQGGGGLAASNPVPPAAAPGSAAVRHRRALRLILGTLMVAMLGAEAVLVSPYVGHAVRSLSHPDPGWLLCALLAELASMGAAAQLHRRMLFAGGIRVPLRQMLVLTYAANAVSLTLPAGSALSSGYTFRRLRAWGASVPLASFTLISSCVLSTVSFGLLGLFGALLAGTDHSDLASLVGGVAVAVGVGLLARRLSRNPDALVHLSERALGRLNRLLRRDPDIGRGRVHRFVDELIQIRPRGRDWSAGIAFALVNWVADLACLIAACQAIGAHGATIELLVVAYLAGMAVSSLSLLPGGLGVVDAAMILALAHGGLDVASATATVVLYRLISFIFIAAVGWGMWAGSWRANAKRQDPRGVTGEAWYDGWARRRVDPPARNAGDSGRAGRPAPAGSPAPRMTPGPQ